LFFLRKLWGGLEANPCPAYSYYEAHTGQPIARAVARYLAGADS
jgi:hypothetical protein